MRHFSQTMLGLALLLSVVCTTTANAEAGSPQPGNGTQPTTAPASCGYIKKQGECVQSTFGCQWGQTGGCYETCTIAKSCNSHATAVSGNGDTGCNCTYGNGTQPTTAPTSCGYIKKQGECVQSVFGCQWGQTGGCYETCTIAKSCNSHATAVSGNGDTGCNCTYGDEDFSDISASTASSAAFPESGTSGDTSFAAVSEDSSDISNSASGSSSTKGAPTLFGSGLRSGNGAGSGSSVPVTLLTLFFVLFAAGMDL